MRLNPEVVRWMTIGEVVSAMAGWAEQENQREQAAWERTRWQSWLMLQPYARRLKITDLARFPWEDQAVSPEEFQKAKERGRELANKWKTGSKPIAKLM